MSIFGLVAQVVTYVSDKRKNRKTGGYRLGVYCIFNLHIFGYYGMLRQRCDAYINGIFDFFTSSHQPYFNSSLTTSFATMVPIYMLYLFSRELFCRRPVRTPCRRDRCFAPHSLRSCKRLPADGVEHGDKPGRARTFWPAPDPM